MNKELNKGQLTAILYIITELYNFRMGLEKTTIIANLDNDIKNDIITEIKTNYGLDYNTLKNDADRIKYEECINNYLTLILSRNKNTSIEDEIELLKESISINPEEIKFPKPEIVESIVDFFSDVKISMNSIHSWFINPDYIKLFTDENKKNYICTKKISIKGVKKVLLYHMGVYLGVTKVYSLFIFNFKKFDDMFNNPIRLFLYALDEYGLEVNINNSTKKFHLNIYSTDNKLEIMNVPKKSDHMGFFMGTKTSKSNFHYSFAYAINLTEYKNDYLKRNI